MLILTCIFGAPAQASAVDATDVSPIRVGIGDQSAAMFGSPLFAPLGIKRTRYFVRSNLMQDRDERLKARRYVKAARAAGVSTLLHISATDLRADRGRLVSMLEYRRSIGRIVRYFRKLGVRDFGAWNEANHRSQQTWNRVGHAVSYFKSMYRTVKRSCRTCAVVGLDVVDQPEVDRYIQAFYERLSATWRQRLTIVGIHNYSDVNMNDDPARPDASPGTSLIIRAVHAFNRRVRFWFTETGALVSFRTFYPYSEERQATRLHRMFRFAHRYRRSGVARVYSYNWFAAESGPCGETCKFDAGLVSADGTARPSYRVFAMHLREFSR